MNIKSIHILAISICASIFMTSCASMKMTDLKPTPKNSKLLPTLQTRIDISSFESAYTLGTSTSISTGTVYGRSRTGTNSTSVSGIGVSVSSTTMSKDPRIQDAITIFDRDVKDNITDPFGESKGYILCKINASNQKTNLGWAFLSGLTLMIPNIFGMPMGSYKITLDVDIEIYNNSEKLIARYNGTAESKKYMAAYWGYGKDVERMANITAFRDTLNQIKIAIENDYSNIILKLEN
ncbi:MAG: hypothetical protein QM535_21950 [Limnohabitans sp.]|nr:hypothetical protein [Limnohabitans sp.]